MATKNQKAKDAEQKAAEEKAEQEKAANRGEADVETTAQQEEREVPTSAQEVDDAADTGFEEEHPTEVDSALGVVHERDAHGVEYDVPWKFLTVEDVDEHTRVRTSDSDDPARSWTNQETVGEGDDAKPVALVPVQQTPGQTFRVSELPSVESLKAAGIDPAQFLSGLPVRPDVEDEAPRRGIPA